MEVGSNEGIELGLWRIDGHLFEGYRRLRQHAAVQGRIGLEINGCLGQDDALQMRSCINNNLCSG